MKRKSNRASRPHGIWAKLDDAVLGDLFGELSWMIVLVFAVAAVVGLAYLFSLRS